MTRPIRLRTSRPAKYAAVPTVVDGYRFDSKAEARRYSELRLLVLAKEITELQVHPRIPLVVSGVHVADYIGDFLLPRPRRHRHPRGREEPGHPHGPLSPEA